MKKKIFMILESLRPGGSERVFWILSQYFSKEDYAVSVVILNGNDQNYPADIKGVCFIDLGTIKASRSFFKLYRLLKTEKPFAVFSTTDHINLLTAMVACFLKIPHLIARASNNPELMRQFYDHKTRFFNLFTRFLSHRFDIIVCQSDEMRQSMAKSYGIRKEKLRVIPNPVLPSKAIRKQTMYDGQYRLIVIARMSGEKGLFRLLEVMCKLPENYVLTFVGDGPLKGLLKAYVTKNGLSDRVTFLGKITNVSDQIVLHDLFVLTSFTEGFPNVLLESLAVGVPVVTFRVGGAEDIVREGFNGFIVDQGDLIGFKNKIVEACLLPWPHQQIERDVFRRFALDKIGQAYKNLLCQ